MLWDQLTTMQKKVTYTQGCFRFLRVGLLFFYFVAPYSLFAQSDSTKKLKEVKIQTKPIPQIQTITPSQQISSEDFDRYSAFNVADAIRNFAGVNVKDYGGIGGLKTVSVRGLGANHTAVLYDGVAINDEENGQIDLGKFNLEGIAQITLYNAQPDNILTPARSFASASVISINTVQPRLTVEKSYQFLVGLKAGSFGLINPYAQWQQRISNNWSFIINSYLENANGRYKYKNIGFGSDSTQTRNNAAVSDQEIDGALYWAKSDSSKFNLHINYYNSDRGLPSAVVPVSHQQLWNRNIFVQSGYEHAWTDGFNLLLNTKLSQEYTRYRDPDYLNNAGGLDDRYTQREFYQSAALSYRLAANWEVSYAADVSFSNLRAYSPNGAIYKYAFPSRFTLLNVLASKFTVGRLLLQGNLLNSYVNEHVKAGTATPAKTALSPTLIASIKPFKNQNVQLRAFYKDIFREPTFDEQYLFAINGSRDLKPEFAKQYDIGFTYRKAIEQFLDYINVSVDMYYNTVTNKIVAVPNQNLEIPTITNLGKVRIEGADVSINTNTKTANGWRGELSLNYSYQYAVDVDRDQYYLQQIAYTPKNTLAANAGINYYNVGVYFNQLVASSRYFGGQSTPQNFLDGYGISDLSFIYKFIAYSKNAVLALHLDNLFNQNYVIVRSFPMPGLSILASLQIKI